MMTSSSSHVKFFAELCIFWKFRCYFISVPSFTENGLVFQDLDRRGNFTFSRPTKEPQKAHLEYG